MCMHTEVICPVNAVEVGSVRWHNPSGEVAGAL